MKKKLYAAVVLTALCTLVCQAETVFSAKDFNGNTVDQTVFKSNKVTMLNIWGTFCGPCIREMPDLAKLHAEYAGKGFQIIGIPIDIVDKNASVLLRKYTDAKTIIEKTGADYTHLVPSKQLMNSLLKNIQVVPTTLFIDENGRQIGKPVAGAKSYNDWKKLIDPLLELQK